MRFPLVRRRSLDAAQASLASVEAKLADTERRRADFAKAASRLGHDRDEALRDALRLAADFRLLRVTLENLPHERVTLRIDLATEVLVRGYRYDRAFQTGMALYVEEMFMRSDVGRDVMRKGSW